MGLIKRLGSLLKKHQSSVDTVDDNSIDSFDSDFIDNIEDVLLEAGLSPKLAYIVLDNLERKKTILTDQNKTIELLKGLLVDYVYEYPIVLDNDRHIFLFVGVNGVGKTTSIAKFIHYLQTVRNVSSEDIVVAAGDTFRAGAIEQLGIHCDRLGVHMIKQGAGSDPAAVIYDSMSYAKARNIKYIIADTAGRMNNRKDLITQLQKIYKILQKELALSQITSFIVLDGNSGLNTLTQVEDFSHAIPIEAIILSKYDGSTKGGTLISIGHTYQIPCAFVGTGETYQDLQVFEKGEFIDEFLSY